MIEANTIIEANIINDANPEILNLIVYERVDINL